LIWIITNDIEQRERLTAHQRSAASAISYSMGDEHNTRKPTLKLRKL